MRPVAYKAAVEPVYFHYNAIPQIKASGYNVVFSVKVTMPNDNVTC